VSKVDLVLGLMAMIEGMFSPKGLRSHGGSCQIHDRQQRANHSRI